MSIYGNPVMLGGSGGGGGGDVPLLTRAQWDALSIAQKQAYGLVAIQDANSGFDRGELVYGADYADFEVLQSGRGATSATFTAQYAGNLKLLVIALNSEASTKELTVTAFNGAAELSGASIGYNAYSSSGSNRRNYRVMLFDAPVVSGDEIAISLANYSNYTGLVWALVTMAQSTLYKALSTPDSDTTGTSDASGVVFYGTFVSNNSGTINGAEYTAGTSISTGYPGSSYASSYIFWLT